MARKEGKCQGPSVSLLTRGAEWSTHSLDVLLDDSNALLDKVRAWVLLHREGAKKARLKCLGKVIVTNCLQLYSEDARCLWVQTNSNSQMTDVHAFRHSHR